jgi:DNA-binding NarL/FixJ family response regulator
MIRLLLADDHHIVREGLKKLMALTPDIRVTAEAANGLQVLEAIKKSRFDLLLLDLAMPGISGLELISRIQPLASRLPILVLSMNNEPQIAMRTIMAGAAGYLTKDCDPDRLFTAIRKTAVGGHFIDPAIAEQFVFDQRSGAPPQPEQLTGRELEVLRLITKGISLKEIATMLEISSKTVSTHKARLTIKLGLKNNADLIRYGLSHGLDS